MVYVSLYACDFVEDRDFECSGMWECRLNSDDTYACQRWSCKRPELMFRDSRVACLAEKIVSLLKMYEFLGAIVQTFLDNNGHD